jgi:uncharacterized protein
MNNSNSQFQLESITLRPLKSCGMVDLQVAEVRNYGLKGDSQYAIVDGEGKIINQKSKLGQKLAKVEVFIRGDEWLVRLPTHDTFYLPQEPFDTEETGSLLSIYKDKVLVNEVNPDFSLLFSHFLDTPCRLVAKKTTFARQITRQRYIQAGVRDGALQDGYPISVLGKSSWQLLEQKHQTTVDINRFRVNLIFGGGGDNAPAHLEDKAKMMLIGNSSLFRFIEKIPRCVSVEINQSTGTIEGDEVLKTLQTYRHLPKEHNPNKKGIFFGAGYTPGECAVGSYLKVGDNVEFIF